MGRFTGHWQSMITRQQSSSVSAMGSFNRGYAQSIRGFWLQACITLCSAFAFTLFGKRDLNVDEPEC